MAGFGASEEDIAEAIEKLAEEQPERDFVIWHDNWESWQIFRRVSSDWKQSSVTGELIGLDKPSLVAVIDLFVDGREQQQSTFDDVRFIEYGVLDYLKNGEKL